MGSALFVLWQLITFVRHIACRPSFATDRLACQQVIVGVIWRLVNCLVH